MVMLLANELTTHLHYCFQSTANNRVMKQECTTLALHDVQCIYHLSTCGFKRKSIFRFLFHLFQQHYYKLEA